MLHETVDSKSSFSFHVIHGLVITRLSEVVYYMTLVQQGFFDEMTSLRLELKTRADSHFVKKIFRYFSHEIVEIVLNMRF